MIAETEAHANIPIKAAAEQFHDAMRQRGLIPPQQIMADGRIHRCDVEGKNGNKDGAYLLHPDGIPAGGFENHKDGIGWENWRADIGRSLTPLEESGQKVKAKSMRCKRDAEIAERQEKGKKKAKTILSAAKPATGEHTYEQRKALSACPGVMRGAWPQRRKDDCLLIPMYDGSGKLCNVQAIFSEKDQALDRDKDFLFGAHKAGLYFPIGKLDGAGTIFVGEGYATMVSCHLATGLPAVAAFDAGNILPVVEVIRQNYPAAHLIIAGDDDKWNATNKR